MEMSIKNMDKPPITMPEVPEDTAIRVDLFVW